MISHTPGPWVYEGIAGDNRITSRHKSGKEFTVATISLDSGFSIIPNCQLVCAAPELLDALEELMRATRHSVNVSEKYEPTKDDLRYEAYKRAKEVVKKARGDSR